MIKLANWQERMSEDMRLRDFRPKTQDAYLRVVRQFMEYAQKEPATLVKLTCASISFIFATNEC